MQKDEDNSGNTMLIISHGLKVANLAADLSFSFIKLLQPPPISMKAHQWFDILRPIWN